MCIVSCLLMVDCFINSGTFKGHGNSFHGDSGRGNRLSQLRYSLRLLLSMCSGGDEMITRDLHEQGVIPLLISILKRLFESDQSNLPVLLEMQADILLITSSVCEVDMHRKVQLLYMHRLIRFRLLGLILCMYMYV